MLSKSKKFLIAVVVFLATVYFLFVFRPILEHDRQDQASDIVALMPTSQSHTPILPLHQPHIQPAKKIALGKQLFHEVRLSADNTIACSSCHNLQTGGVDRLQFSVGINGATGDVNAPTVFNSGLNIAQFWDGRAESLEEQAAGPVHNPLEMGSNWAQVIPKLQADKVYPALFDELYTDGITPDNIVDAIATFERTLITTGSRFDQYLLGDTQAISPDELKGYQLFVNLGCASCHQGAAIGGNMFQRFGVMDDYFKNRPTDKADMGRFNVTGQEDDKHVFKVPSLRIVMRTPPYFHDGSANTAKEAISIMGKYQLGVKLSDEDIRLLIAFLHSIDNAPAAASSVPGTSHQ